MSASATGAHVRDRGAISRSSMNAQRFGEFASMRSRLLGAIGIETMSTVSVLARLIAKFPLLVRKVDTILKMLIKMSRPLDIYVLSKYTLPRSCCRHSKVVFSSDILPLLWYPVQISVAPCSHHALPFAKSLSLTGRNQKWSRLWLI